MREPHSNNSFGGRQREPGAEREREREGGGWGGDGGVKCVEERGT